ncbi:MAG: nucleotidyltransferase family protein [Anaerolineae bacterium]|nr:nucleotidyltransferase family protein [Anaerolineae bacterium]
MSIQVAIPYDQIAAFCQRNHIHNLALFGSVLRDDFRPDSDIDVLVEFVPEHVPGFFGLIAMQEELAAMLGQHPVDLITPNFLNRHIRDQVLADAQVIYGEG